MNPPDLLDRARTFAAHSKRSTALRIIPLAALAAVAHAYTNGSNGQVAVSNDMLPTVTQLSDTNGVQGISFTNGYAEFTATTPAGYSSGMGLVENLQYGNQIQQGGAAVEVTYDFIIGDSGGSLTEGWEVVLDGENGTDVIASGASGGAYSGTVDTNLPLSSPDGSWDASILFSANYPNGGGEDLQINELQIAAATPEPSSLILSLSGLSLLAARLKRKA
jgi:hypothetical protein